MVLSVDLELAKARRFWCLRCPVVGCGQVLLARQIEQNAKDFAAWRKQREREVAQLRKQGRKQQMQACRSILPLAHMSFTLLAGMHTISACLQLHK